MVEVRVQIASPRFGGIGCICDVAAFLRWALLEFLGVPC